MLLHVRPALRRFVAEVLSSRRAALFMILTLACWSGEGFAKNVLSVTPAHCKYRISLDPEAAGPGWTQPGFDDSGWASSLPAADSYLPPGLVSEASYLESSFLLDGKAVTLLSDGVLEARDAKGELLGFERMAALTTRPAAEVADAAQKWGQEDDITVVTVRSL
jgi:hypothetical protein